MSTSSGKGLELSGRTTCYCNKLKICFSSFDFDIYLDDICSTDGDNAKERTTLISLANRKSSVILGDKSGTNLDTVTSPYNLGSW